MPVEKIYATCNPESVKRWQLNKKQEEEDELRREREEVEEYKKKDRNRRGHEETKTRRSRVYALIFQLAPEEESDHVSKLELAQLVAAKYVSLYRYSDIRLSDSCEKKLFIFFSEGDLSV